MAATDLFPVLALPVLSLDPCVPALSLLSLLQMDLEWVRD